MARRSAIGDIRVAEYSNWNVDWSAAIELIFDVRLFSREGEGSANTKQQRLQKTWKRRRVMPEPHLFVGLIKRTSFSFDEYFRFRSTFVPLLFLSLGFRCLVILPTLFHLSAFLPPSTLSNSPPVLDLYPRRSRYSLEALSFNFAENSCLLCSFYLLPSFPSDFSLRHFSHSLPLTESTRTVFSFRRT